MLHSPQIKEKITMDIRSYSELNENKNSAYQNLRTAFYQKYLQP